MSIPKEPRALMINLMYLVLTAMLALNVSAEIINAFFSLEKGIKGTNEIVDKSNKQMLGGMQSLVEVKTQFVPLYEAAQKVQPIIDDFTKLIDGFREEMIEKSGGKYPDPNPDNPKYAGKPKGYKDIDTPTRLFVVEGRGPKIKAAIDATRAALVKIVEDVALIKMPGVNITQGKIDSFKISLPLVVDDVSWKSSGKPTWEAFTFGYMPVAALYPLFRKWQNDAYSSGTITLSFLADNMGKLDIKFDQFEVFSSSQKPYILLGEEYSAELSLGASSKQAKFTISVNGGSLPVTNGKAIYKSRPSKTGEQKYTANVSLTNPMTNEVVKATKDFFFEVGQPSVNVSADKMNVFYIGVDNPISVAAAGVSSNDIGVSASGGGINLSSTGKSSFNVKVASQGEAVIKVTDKKSGKQLGEFKFRVKKIPDPVAQIGGKTGGSFGSGQMSAQLGVMAVLENFDFEAKCDIQSYTLYYTKKRQDPQALNGSGARFDAQVAAAVRAAGIGDSYNFVDIKARCPGDATGRTINTIGITIK
jgi:gliding motility-associated protein GldM